MTVEQLYGICASLAAGAMTQVLPVVCRCQPVEVDWEKPQHVSGEANPPLIVRLAVLLRQQANQDREQVARYKGALVKWVAVSEREIELVVVEDEEEGMLYGQ